MDRKQQKMATGDNCRINKYYLLIVSFTNSLQQVINHHCLRVRCILKISSFAATVSVDFSGWPHQNKQHL